MLREKWFRLSSRRILKLTDKHFFFFSGSLTADEMLVFHFELDMKRQYLEWQNPQSLGKKNFRKLLSAGKFVFTAVSDCAEVIVVDVMPRWETATSDVARPWQAFEMSWASQESGINLASMWECKATHQFEGQWICHKIWKEIFTPSVLHPHCHPHISTCLEIWRMLSAVELETNGNVIYSWELGCMSRTRHTFACSLLAQGHRSWLRLYGKQVYRVKPSPSLCVIFIILAERKNSGH